MDKDVETSAEAKKKAEARNTLLVGLILGGLIVALIAGMLVFAVYTDESRGSGAPPADSAAAAGS